MKVRVVVLHFIFLPYFHRWCSQTSLSPSASHHPSFPHLPASFPVLPGTVPMLLLCGSYICPGRCYVRIRNLPRSENEWKRCRAQRWMRAWTGEKGINLLIVPWCMSYKRVLRLNDMKARTITPKERTKRSLHPSWFHSACWSLGAPNPSAQPFLGPHPSSSLLRAWVFPYEALWWALLRLASSWR